MSIGGFHCIKHSLYRRLDGSDTAWFCASRSKAYHNAQHCEHPMSLHCWHPFDANAASRTEAALVSENIGPVRVENAFLPTAAEIKPYAYIPDKHSLSGAPTVRVAGFTWATRPDKDTGRCTYSLWESS
jgi:hypothetical protein